MQITNQKILMPIKKLIRVVLLDEMTITYKEEMDNKEGMTVTTWRKLWGEDYLYRSIN